MATYTAERVYELLNKTITKDNIDTSDSVILIINEKLKNDIRELYDKSKICKKCNKYFVIEGRKHSWCPPCKKSYMKVYKKDNGSISRTSKKHKLDYGKEGHCATCKTTKPIDEFYSNNIYRCKSCVSKKALESRKKRKALKKKEKKSKSKSKSK